MKSAARSSSNRSLETSAGGRIAPTHRAGRGDLITAGWLALFAALFGLLLVRNFALDRPELGTLRFGRFIITPFGPLVALGILFGVHLMHRWAARFDLEWERLLATLGWLLVVGFVGSHLLDVALYDPRALSSAGALLDLRHGYSSLGGLLSGGLIAAWAFRRNAVPLLRGMECTLYGFVGGWLFGRLACFSVHDHPGVRTSSPLGVEIGGAVRHDLGFYELLYTIAVFAILYATTRRRRYDGYVIALVATTYAPVRFALDFLRVSDATYGGLTPAQWACIPLLAIGIAFIRLRPGSRTDRRRASGLPPC